MLKTSEMEISKVLSKMLSEIRKHDTEGVFFVNIEGNKFKITNLGLTCQADIEADDVERATNQSVETKEESMNDERQGGEIGKHA